MQWKKQEHGQDKPQNEQDMEVPFKKWTDHWTHLLVIHGASKYAKEYGKDKPQNEQGMHRDSI